MSDDLRRLVLRVQTAYPRVYLACHREHQPVGRHGETLSDKDNRLLAHLDLERATPPTELARHLGIGKSTLSEALERLVERGLVERSPRSDDRRRVDLRLSLAGAAALSASSVLDAGRLARLLGRLSAPEREEAVRGLELLAEAARRERG